MKTRNGSRTEAGSNAPGGCWEEMDVAGEENREVDLRASSAPRCGSGSDRGIFERYTPEESESRSGKEKCFQSGVFGFVMVVCSASAVAIDVMVLSALP